MELIHGVALAPMGEARPDLSPSDREAFVRGREIALRRFGASSGLGPDFNATFCLACHEKPVFGGTSSRYRDVFVRVQPGPELSVQPQFDLWGSTRAEDEPGFATSVRSARPLFGLGQLAQVPVSEILEWVDASDEDGDGISGRVNFEQGFVGRFGHKAQMASLTSFIRLALVDHLGLTSEPPQFDLGHGPMPRELPARDDDGVPDPELPAKELEDLVRFVNGLAGPLPNEPTFESEHGSQIFIDCACTSCHRPYFDGPDGPITAFTDLLLHDMGPGLADGIQLGQADGSEFRTPPLWGVVVSGPYLHDGRADMMKEAILWHGGEAEPSQQCFEDATPDDQDAVIAFLTSLGGSDQNPAGLVHPQTPVPTEGEPGAPSATMTKLERARFARGRALFDRDFGFREGVGPLYNADSCRSCHFDPIVGGSGPLGVDVLRYASGESSGTVAHRFNIELTRPSVQAGSVFVRRQTPTILGLGRIDSITDAEILSRADPEDRDGDSIRGRASVLEDGRIGRFGWQAQVPTLRDFLRDAMTTELGLTVPEDGSHFGSSSDADDVVDPELSSSQLEDLLFFMRNLSPPVPRGLSESLRRQGEHVFEQVGCARCHVPVLRDVDGADVALWSDLLLHDVSPAKRRLDEVSTSSPLIRTPPLWGVGETAPYWHDGSAETLEDAVERHEGEAARVTAAFRRLASSDREALLELLTSL